MCSHARLEGSLDPSQSHRHQISYELLLLQLLVLHKVFMIHFIDHILIDQSVYGYIDSLIILLILQPNLHPTPN